MKLSVVIPAYNEENYLGPTLDAIRSELSSLGEAELIVVDNESTDATRDMADAAGARVIDETVHNISQVRNTGEHAAKGDVVVFIDADTIVAEGLFAEILTQMSDPKCFGGSVAVRYTESTRRWMRYYLMCRLFWGKFLKMRQGAAQFCRTSVSEELGGYDATIYVGEDIEFHWRLDKLAKKNGGHTAFIEKPDVLTSCRRFSKMSLPRLLFVTHPITILLGWRVQRIWKDWYEDAVR